MNSCMYTKYIMIASMFSGSNLTKGYTPKAETENAELIRRYLFNIVVNFVEDENALQEVLWDCDNDHIAVKMKLISIYDWITKERPLLVSKIEQLRDSFPEIENDDNSLLKSANDSHIEDILSSEKMLRTKDQTVLKDIIDLRDYLTIV